MLRFPASALRLGIRQKMVLVLLGVLLISLTGAGWLTLRDQKQDIIEQTRSRGEDLSRFVSQALTFSVVGYDYHSIQMLLEEIVQSQDIAFASVRSDRGNVMASAGAAVVPSVVPGRWITFDRDIVFDGKKVGALTLGLDNARIVQQLEERRDALVRREAVLILLIALGEFLALSYVIVRPVSVISQSLAQGVGADGSITGDIPLTSKDEFGQLAAQFNGMRAQLNEANQRLLSKVDLADAQLRESNRQLLRQSRELRRVNEELTQLSLTDPLTGLYNRRHFEGIMESELAMYARHGEPCCLLLLDIDHFKRVNDTYGHKVGDLVLRQVAHTLERCLRKTDVLCRIGGEEFLVLCRRTDRADGRKIADELRRQIERTAVDVDRTRIQVTVSVGLTALPPDGAAPSAEECFRRADAALYSSKAAGRNRISDFDDLGFPGLSEHA